MFYNNALSSASETQIFLPCACVVIVYLIIPFIKKGHKYKKIF